MLIRLTDENNKPCLINTDYIVVAYQDERTTNTLLIIKDHDTHVQVKEALSTILDRSRPL